MKEISLELKNIEKSFSSEEEVLRGINLTVEKGEFVTILGASGCGKTTTLRIIAGLETPDSGRVFLNGKDVTDLEPNKRDVNTVFQSYALFPHLNVAENIGYGLKLKKVPKPRIRERVEEMLEMVQLQGYGKRKTSELSGGQRQRVAVARALINNPGVLLLDEPLGALDLQLRRAMQTELKTLQKKLGITFIYITHDREEAFNMSDRIAVMNQGQFEQIGTPGEIFDHPVNEYVAAFGGEVMTRGRRTALWMIAPLYLFTIVFVAFPLIYMVALSFASTDGSHGILWQFTLDNYKKIFEPVYFNTVVQSLKLAFTSTFLICLTGYPFGYFMAKLPEKQKNRAMFLLNLPFWLNSLIRLYGWIIILQKKGVLNYILLKLGVIEKPLSLLYSYPAIVIGMVYVLLPFMIMSVYSSAEKLDWSLVEAARDLGATPARAFFTVTLKLTLPGLLSGIILTFIPSMGLFFIADILGGNKIVLVGSLIQEQMTRGNNWPFAAALAVVMMALTSILIAMYRKITNAKELEGIG